MEDWKIKISVLWLFGIIVALAVILIGVFEPGAIEQIIAGQFEGHNIDPEFMLLLAVIVLVPLVMAFLSLALKNSVNRWANIIVGLAYFVFGLLDLTRYLANSSAYAVLLSLSAEIANILIVWYAWKSKSKA